MANENCLDGVRCSNCGQEHRFFIHALICADVTDDGADIADSSDFHWDESSLVICPECDRDGPMSDFRIPDVARAA